MQRRQLPRVSIRLSTPSTLLSVKIYGRRKASLLAKLSRLVLYLWRKFNTWFSLAEAP
jgi:hypothetical protein